MTEIVLCVWEISPVQKSLSISLYERETYVILPAVAAE